MPTINHDLKTRNASGFTLIEILLALGIFMIGMIAVVSLFPVAALLQRETASDVFGAHAAQSGEAIVMSRGLTYDGDAASSGNTGDLDFYHPNAASTKTTIESISGRFNTADRAYPTSQLNGTNVEGCDLFWVPFVQDLNGDPATPSWAVKVFILEADSRADYTISTGGGINAIANPGDSNVFPKVVSTGCSVLNDNTFTLGVSNHGLQTGDQIMDSNGTDYTISLVDGANISVISPILRTPADPAFVWYAPPLGGSNGSPTKQIITVSISTP